MVSLVDLRDECWKKEAWEKAIGYHNEAYRIFINESTASYEILQVATRLMNFEISSGRGVWADNIMRRAAELAVSMVPRTTDPSNSADRQ